MPKTFNYIDLFAGCGGLSLGLHNSGWNGLFAIEKSPLAFKTLEHNLINNLDHFTWPDWVPKEANDINDILKNHKANLKELRNQVDLVAGGPPCQGFSSAGKRVEDDARNGLIKSYIKFIRIVQPKLIFFENVRGFTQKFEANQTKGKKYSDFVMNCLRRSTDNYTGYEVVGKLIDFSKFGIPQKRTRFILVGVRKDISANALQYAQSFFDSIEFDKTTFLSSKGLESNPTLQDAISDLLMKQGTIASPDSPGFLAGIYDKPQTKYQEFLRKTKPKAEPDSHRFTNHGVETISLFNNLLVTVEKGTKIHGDLRKPYNIKKRAVTVLNPDVPTPTLTSHPDDYIHYCEPRILTVREYARIQSFPDWYELKGKYTTGGVLRTKEVPRYTQLGNAIPPLFAELSGLALQKIINSNSK
jgi:DNA (cytosine-5)-methyltransferase 1